MTGYSERAESSSADIRFESVDPTDARVAELIREIDELTLAMYPGSPIYGIETEGFIDAGGTFLLLHVDDRLAGCGGLRPVADGTVEVKRMYVREDFRGQGLARVLLHKLEKDARDRGVGIMRIETDNMPGAALYLYRTAGYAETPSYGEYVDNPLSICLAKPLLSVADEAFLASFEDCTLPEAEWTHLAHVNVAWLILTQTSSERGLKRLREGILRYNTDVLKRRRKYHETVTVAFARLVSSRINPMENWTGFRSRIADMLDTAKPVLLNYYSDERLFSDDARARFVNADRKTLPDFRDVTSTVQLNE